MTVTRWGAAAGAAVGGLCGWVVWEVFSSRSALAFVAYSLPFLMAYAVLGWYVARPDRPAQRARHGGVATLSTPACPAVLPGHELPAETVVPTALVPRPRVSAVGRS